MTRTQTNSFISRILCCEIQNYREKNIQCSSESTWVGLTELPDLVDSLNKDSFLNFMASPMAVFWLLTILMKHHASQF